METLRPDICPYCKTQFVAGDSVVRCPKCGTLHHHKCWIENGGCASALCAAPPAPQYTPDDAPTVAQTPPVPQVSQDDTPTVAQTPQYTPEAPAVPQAPQYASEAPAAPQAPQYAPEAPAAPQTPQFPPNVFAVSQQQSPAKFCPSCGAALAQDDAFCSKCGKKYTASATDKPKKKKAPKIIAIVAVVLVLAAAALILLPHFGVISFDPFSVNSWWPGKSSSSSATTTTRSSFLVTYADYANKSWCDIGYDGTWIKIDTNPYDRDDSFDSDAYAAIQKIGRDLGFPSSLFQKMGETRALDGRQTETHGSYEVSWSYHPDHGLEVLYTLK